MCRREALVPSRYLSQEKVSLPFKDETSFFRRKRGCLYLGPTGYHQPNTPRPTGVGEAE